MKNKITVPAVVWKGKHSTFKAMVGKFEISKIWKFSNKPLSAGHTFSTYFFQRGKDYVDFDTEEKAKQFVESEFAKFYKVLHGGKNEN